jgi:two-component system KDP operon response regulator KdpE
MFSTLVFVSRHQVFKNMRAIMAIEDGKGQDDARTVLNMCFPDLELLLAGSANQCMQLAREKKPDIIIVDYYLHDIDGGKMVEQIRSITTAPIVVLSYIRDEADVLKAMESGADEYCTKPIKQLEFAARIRALLRRSKATEARSSM